MMTSENTKRNFIVPEPDESSKWDFYEYTSDVVLKSDHTKRVAHIYNLPPHQLPNGNGGGATPADSALTANVIVNAPDMFAYLLFLVNQGYIPSVQVNQDCFNLLQRIVQGTSSENLLSHE